MEPAFEIWNLDSKEIEYKLVLDKEVLQFDWNPISSNLILLIFKSCIQIKLLHYCF